MFVHSANGSQWLDCVSDCYVISRRAKLLYSFRTGGNWKQWHLVRGLDTKWEAMSSDSLCSRRPGNILERSANE
jgi:hypothetical protein